MTNDTHTMAATPASSTPGADARRQFPIFEGVRLAYLDTAASSQKPRAVIDRIARYLSHEHANIHRGAYKLSAMATESYESSRRAVARFVGASDPNCIIFTRGATESINLVARGAERWFDEGDTIVLTRLEHHSNIVPWQMLAERRRLRLEFCDIRPDATVDLDDLARLVRGSNPKLVAITALSNAFGSVTPIEDVVALCREAGALVLLDGAQAVAHGSIDVRASDVDFVAFSAHKMYGPTGIGALYAKHEHLVRMDPFLGGGDMIRSVTVEGSTYADPPQKFEAGTPAIAEAIALEEAIKFVESVGVDRIAAHEQALFHEAFDALSREPGVTIYGPITAGKEQASILAFNLDNVHPHDLSTVADTMNVNFRAGHHCAMPALRRLGLQATARASFGVYSIKEEIDMLVEALRRARKLFG